MAATRWRSTWSGRVSGVLCALALVAPLAVMPFRGGADLEAVERIERRTPAELAIPSVSELLDDEAWGRFAAGFGDRLPFRVWAASRVRAVDRDLLGKKRFGVVTKGEGDWLFYHASIGFRMPDIDELERSIDEVRVLAGELGARLLILAAPDKSTVYPEYLGAAESVHLASLDDRELVRALFRDPARPELLDMWAVQQTTKAGSDDLIYEPTDTHHNWIGAMAMARHVVESLAPGVWEDDAVRLGEPEQRDLGLPRLAGFDGSLGRYVPLSVARDGVRVSMAFDRDGPVEVTPRIRSGPAYYKKPVRVKTAGEAERVPGRTLLLHDSFVDGYLKDALWPYFEDITFVHLSNLRPGDAHGAVGRYDTVIIETVERALWALPRRLRAGDGRRAPLDVRLGVHQRP